MGGMFKMDQTQVAKDVFESKPGNRRKVRKEGKSRE